MWGFLQPFAPFLILEKVRKESYPRIYNYKVLVCILISWSAFTTSKIIFGETIACYSQYQGQTPSDQITSTFCLMNGTFTLEDHKKVMHTEYTYMPFILATCALGFYVPRGLYQHAVAGLFKELIQDLQSSVQEEERKIIQLKKLAH